jgi:hypothetical protein
MAHLKVTVPENSQNILGTVTGVATNQNIEQQPTPMPTESTLDEIQDDSDGETFSLDFDL